MTDTKFDKIVNAIIWMVMGMVVTVLIQVAQGEISKVLEVQHTQELKQAECVQSICTRCTDGFKSEITCEYGVKNGQN